MVRLRYLCLSHHGVNLLEYISVLTCCDSYAVSIGPFAPRGHMARDPLPTAYHTEIGGAPFRAHLLTYMPSRADLWITKKVNIGQVGLVNVKVWACQWFEASDATFQKAGRGATLPPPTRPRVHRGEFDHSSMFLFSNHPSWARVESWLHVTRTNRPDQVTIERNVPRMCWILPLSWLQPYYSMTYGDWQIHPKVCLSTMPFLI